MQMPGSPGTANRKPWLSLGKTVRRICNAVSVHSPQPVVGLCRCCRRDNSLMANSKVPDGLPSGVQVCGICIRHQGNDLRGWTRRDQDHHDLWAEDAGDLAEQHARDLVVARVATETLRAQLAEEVTKRPTNVVYRNLDQETVNEALSSRDAAFRSRDRAFRALCEVWLLHRDAGSGRCRCGRPHSQCNTAAIVDHYPSLEAWERKQWERMRQHLDHWLPRKHPAVIDPKWRPNDGEAHT